MKMDGGVEDSSEPQVPPPPESDDLEPIPSWKEFHSESTHLDADSRTRLKGYLMTISADPGVPERHVPYYGNWVRSYLIFCRERGIGDALVTSQDNFIQDLIRLRRPDFMVRQAESAIGIFRQWRLRPVVGNAEMAKTIPAAKTVDSKSASFPVTWEATRDRMEVEVRKRGYSRKTFKNYWHWVLGFGRYIEFRNPMEAGSAEAKAFLEHLAIERNVAGSTQNQAFNALLFLFNNVLGRNLDGLEDTPRAKKGNNVPEVLSKEEVNRIFGFLNYPYGIFFKLLYGCGLRLGESLVLRIQDIDFQSGCLTIHRGKGAKSIPSVIAMPPIIC